MEHNYFYKLDRLDLEPLSLEHIEKLRLLRNRKEIRHCFLNSNVISNAEQQRWFNNYLKKKDEIMFSVILRSSREFVGALAFYRIDHERNEAEIGRIMLDKKILYGNGWGEEAVRGAIYFGFKVLNLDRIYLEVLENNHRALKLYKKLHFDVISNIDGIVKMDLRREDLIRKRVEHEV